MHCRDILTIHFFQTEPFSEVRTGSSLENMSQPTYQFRTRSSLEWVQFGIAKDWLLTLVKSRLALGSLGWLVGCYC